MKKRTWLQKPIKRIFERQLWHPCRQSVATGLAIGLFASQLPVPGQMILAALWSISLRANVPIAIAACWITNPITQLPTILAQERFGHFLRQHLDIPVHPILEKIQISLKFLGMPDQSLNGGSFILGFLASGVVLSLLAFPLVYLLSALMPKIIPKSRYERAKAFVIARHQKNHPPKTEPTPSSPHHSVPSSDTAPPSPENDTPADSDPPSPPST